MKKKVVHRLLLEFNQVFDEEPLTTSEYLTGISRAQLLTLGAFLLGFEKRSISIDGHKELLENWFSEGNQEFATRVYHKILALQEEYESIQIINSFTSLQLFEHVFGIDQKTTTPFSVSKVDFERRLFKCYLLLNQINTSFDQRVNASVKSVHPDLKPAMFILTQQLAYMDTANYDISNVLVAQMAKAGLFFDFISSDTRVKPHLDTFLGDFEAPDWQSFLKKYMPIVGAVLGNEKETYTDIVVPEGEDFESSCGFFNRLILQDGNELSEYDFVSLRSNPFYEIKKGIYRVIFSLFAVEKIFRGMYFLFSRINNSLPKEESIADFKSFYGNEFSEKFLFYKSLKKSFPKGWVHYSGSDLEREQSGSIDYVLRNGNKFLLFENKDVLLKTTVKQSRYFEKLNAALIEKFFFVDKQDGTRDKKAVLQLIENVKRLLDLKLLTGQKYNSRNIRVYPILVVHERQFSTPGMNKLVNSWFDEELQGLKSDGYNISKVRPITIIEIDTFLLYQKQFANKRIKLEELIDEYIVYTSFDSSKKFPDEEALHSYYKSTLISFSDFVEGIIDERKIKRDPPVFFENLREVLFSPE